MSEIYPYSTWSYNPFTFFGQYSFVDTKERESKSDDYVFNETTDTPVEPSEDTPVEPSEDDYTSDEMTDDLIDSDKVGETPDDIVSNESIYLIMKDEEPIGFVRNEKDIKKCIEEIVNVLMARYVIIYHDSDIFSEHKHKSVCIFVRNRTNLFTYSKCITKISYKQIESLKHVRNSMNPVLY